jgi:hypothetical protein
MKKYATHIIFFILLALVTLFLYQIRRSTTLDGRQMDFAITRPGSVSEITISGPGGEVHLKKSGDGRWLLNSQYEAREKAVNLLLQTLVRLRVTSPAPNTVAADLENKLEVEGTRIEFKRGRRTITYLIYSEGTQSPTYMIKQGTKQAFAVEVIGFSGHTASLFISDISYWRPNVLFNFHINEIAEVIVQHKDPDEGSFRLTRSPQMEFELYSLPGNRPMENISDSLAIRFLSSFFYTPYEGYTGTGETTMVDSLSNIQPDHIINVKNHQGAEVEVSLFKIIVNSRPGEQAEFDPFRLHALIDDETEVVTVPYQSVDLLLRSASYFYP